MSKFVENVQVSVDALDVDHRMQAYDLRMIHDNVVLRGVELCARDAWLRKQVDVQTVFHGWPIEGLETYRTTATSHKTLCKRIQKTTDAKVCCATGKCITCRKCWKIAK
jgi:hypothetical protein